jgi:hypothetical protein
MPCNLVNIQSHSSRLQTSDFSDTPQQPANDWLGTRHSIVRGRILVNLILAVARGKGG